MPEYSKIQSALIVPTFQAAKYWPAFCDGLRSQTVWPHRFIVLDSSSSDGTKELARDAGAEVFTIPKDEFDHGRTRQLGCDLCPEAEVLLYMTQDAVLHEPHALERLLGAFTQPQVGAAYGRQLPRPQSTAIEAHARLFNYPTVSSIRNIDSRKNMGFRAAFLSNSFSAYRRSVLTAVQGFPTHTIFAEDSIVAARMLLAGWKTAYVADATVIHSHAYTVRQDFHRYFDIGVFHARERWLLENFGSASGEGLRFVRSELASLWPGNIVQVPEVFLRTAAKWLAYRLGRKESSLPLGWKKRMSMSPGFWDQDRDQTRKPR